MAKAFIFDLDGVIINTEPKWESAKKEFFTKLLGEDIYKKLGTTVGISIENSYKKAVELGASVTNEEFREKFFSYAPEIYRESPITKGLDDLERTLSDLGYAIGVVSASPRSWVDLALKRLSFKDRIKVVLSLDEREDLPHKPEPDGYLEAMRMLGAEPGETIILEDSETGIKSAKATGAFVIGLRENLVPGQTQSGAHAYADDVKDVIKIVQKRVNK